MASKRHNTDLGIEFTTDDCLIVDRYTERVGPKNRVFLEVQTPFGICKVREDGFKAGYCPSIKKALNKSQYFINIAKQVFGEEGNDDLSQVEYINTRTKIQVLDPVYGAYWILPHNYLYGQRCPKKFYAESRLEEAAVFEDILKMHPGLEICDESKYNTSQDYLFIKDKYGIMRSKVSNLLMGKCPNIESAVDKNTYFANKSREVHGEKYDYSLVEYRNAYTKVKIIGPNGVFEQAPNTHLQGCGCPIEGNKSTARHSRENKMGWEYSSWEAQGNSSKYFDSFKVYIIECWDEQTCEHFYKIGKTFLKVFAAGNKGRFSKAPAKSLPYKGKIIEVVEGGAREICELEKKLQKQNKEYEYIPQNPFLGMYECFSKIKQKH